jgi:hypothetical protein
LVAKYRRGYTGRDFHVTGGHEAEARAAQRAKKPNRFGVWVLRVLGYEKSVPGEQKPPRPPPAHEAVAPRRPGHRMVPNER